MTVFCNTMFYRCRSSEAPQSAAGKRVLEVLGVGCPRLQLDQLMVFSSNL